LGSRRERAEKEAAATDGAVHVWWWRGRETFEVGRVDFDDAGGCLVVGVEEGEGYGIFQLPRRLRRLDIFHFWLTDLF